MRSVKLIDQLLGIGHILRWFPTSPYVTGTCPLCELMQLLVASLSIGDLVNFPFVSVIQYRQLWFSWRLAGGRRYKAVMQ